MELNVRSAASLIISAKEDNERDVDVDGKEGDDDDVAQAWARDDVTREKVNFSWKYFVSVSIWYASGERERRRNTLVFWNWRHSHRTRLKAAFIHTCGHWRDECPLIGSHLPGVSREMSSIIQLPTWLTFMRKVCESCSVGLVLISVVLAQRVET